MTFFFFLVIDESVCFQRIINYICVLGYLPPTGHSDGVGSEGSFCSQAIHKKRAAFGCQFIALSTSED